MFPAFFRNEKCVLYCFKSEKYTLPFFDHQQKGKKMVFLLKTIKSYLKNVHLGEFLSSNTSVACQNTILFLDG